MFHRMVTTGFKDVIEAYQVRLYIGFGIGNGLAYTSLCGKVHDNLRLVLLKETVNG